MRNIKKVALYSPYLDILGGGEKHILSILKVFDEEGFKIEILWDDKKITKSIKNNLNISFSNLKIVLNFLKKSGFLTKLNRLKEYDFFLYVTDGSYFVSTSPRNYIFCMYPEKDLYNDSLLNKLKWHNFEFIANSKYTKRYIDEWTRKKSTAIYPYVDDIFLKKADLKKKDKIILSAGRYFGHLHSKRQDLLIKAFIKLQQKNKMFKNFKLIFIGRLQEEDKAYFNELRMLASSNKNIHFLTNVSFQELISFYRRASFLWHASGLTEVGRAGLQSVEHLGIVPLEAMASGVVPFCHDSGGPKELIKDGINGFLYKTADELIGKTIQVYKNEKKRIKVAVNGKNFIEKNFSYKVFREKVKKYFEL